jgi:hypothetical protein
MQQKSKLAELARLLDQVSIIADLRVPGFGEGFEVLVVRVFHVVGEAASV